MIVEKQLNVVNKLGLHARAAAKLVKMAGGFNCTVMLHKGEKVVDVKSIMGVLMLAAAQGSMLQLVTDGDDAEQAANDIQALFDSYFDEGE